MAVAPVERAGEGVGEGARRSLTRSGGLGSNFGDNVFYWGTAAFAASVLVVCALLFGILLHTAWPSIQRFGAHFLYTSTWDPVQEVYGALPFVYGTLVSSFLALLMAVPIGLGTAIFLAELAPGWLRTPLSFMIELLAAVPSVVYGLWGIFVLVPMVRGLETWLQDRFPWVPFFSGAPYGIGMLSAGLILAIMILPFIIAVSRDVLRAVPPTLREAAFGLGATHWEAIWGPMLRSARVGIMGAIILGLARALGETMAVTMVIGNTPTIPGIKEALFSQGYTLASVLANEFAEATTDMYISALVQLALILFGVTIIVNAIARLLIWSMVRNTKGMRV